MGLVNTDFLGSLRIFANDKKDDMKMKPVKPKKRSINPKSKTRTKKRSKNHKLQSPSIEAKVKISTKNHQAHQ